MTDIKTFPVEYKVYIWDKSEKNAETFYGVTMAKSYAEAMDNIEKYYGNSIIEISLYGHEEGTVYEFNWDDENPYLSKWLKTHFPTAC